MNSQKISNLEWEKLPNAEHITNVITHCTNDPGKRTWNAAWFIAFGNKTWSDIVKRIRPALRNRLQDMGRLDMRYAAWTDSRNSGREYGAGEWHGGVDGAWYAITALVAYDDCAKYLEYSPEELRIWGILTEEPGAILLLPAVIAMNTK